MYYDGYGEDELGYAEYDENELGIPIPAIGGAISAIGGLFGGGQDKQRFAMNQMAYTQAISGADGPFQGFPSAMDFLAGKAAGGWATTAAKKDAASKYAAAQKIIATKPAVSSSPIANILTGGVAGAGGGGLNTMVMIGGAAVLVYLMSQKRR